MKPQVVAAVIQRAGKFLLGKRSPWKRSTPGYWCPISGQIEPGETEEDAVAREVREEVGLIVTAVKKVGEFETHDGTALIHWWLGYLSTESFKRTTFEFAPKDKSITLRVSSELLSAVQDVAKKKKTNYQKLIREAIEEYLQKAN
ncbi:MAG: hypothetical protein A2428_10135 [Bdellovibrionales bacterium RIFOXYC1_FULL_54_43]|nr:MAG: hypothetical protein A2428_10135 [Bdellovibrionales bacterium RIFOXYC1_FULL_54_43]OFZ80541.1 MAG: hypothetical protein A2603_13230 [Bdellovibrionales bacterium RIFOXYD1_FULL_55_31]